MPRHSFSRKWLWFALLFLGLNILLLEAGDGGGPLLIPIAAVADRHDSLFSLADYAFWIWGFIYAAFVGYVLYALSPRQAGRPVHACLARGLVAYALLDAAWAVSFACDLIALSLICMFGLVWVGARMFQRAHRATAEGEAPAFFLIPFSLYFGWISIMAVAHASVWLKIRGWTAEPWIEERWTVIMLTGVILLGILIGRRYREITYPLAVLWGLWAVWIDERGDCLTVSCGALLGSCALLAWLIGHVAWLRHHPAVVRVRARGRNFLLTP